MFKIFKKDKEKINPPIWETDFEKFLESAGVNELEKYTDTLPEGKEIDLTNQYWGHAYSVSRSIGKYAYYGHGFYGAIINCAKISAGDILLLKSEKHAIGKYLVLKIEYERDPKDMFWAYIVCIGHKD